MKKSSKKENKLVKLIFFLFLIGQTLRKLRGVLTILQYENEYCYFLYCCI